MKRAVILIVVFLAIAMIVGGVFLFSNYSKSKEGLTSDNSLSDVKTRGKLIVGSEVPYGVMDFLDSSGNSAGINFDIAKEIASKMGVELEYKDYDWEQLFPVMDRGEIDLNIASITITEDRAKKMLFSIPYFNGGQTILVKADNENIKLPEDLNTKKVGVEKGTTGHYAAQKYTSEDLIVFYPDFISTNTSGIFYDLKIGTIDAVILDYIAAVGAVKENPSLKFAGEPFTQEYYGIATKLGNNELMDEVNKILRELKRTGKLDEIKNKQMA